MLVVLVVVVAVVAVEIFHKVSKVDG